MLRSFKKFVSLMLILTLSLVVCLPAFAASNTKDVKDSGVKDSSFTYISQTDAVLLANQCIKEQVAIGNHCCWTKSTKISETAALFDFGGNANAYLFRLTTNGKRTGYVFVNAYAKAPSVEAFGYDCDFMLDAMLPKNHKSSVTTSDHIIYADSLVFLTQNKSENYFVIGDKTEKLEASKSDLMEDYRNNLQRKADALSQSNLTELKVNTIKPMGQTIYSQHNVSGIWSSGYHIYLMSDFTGYTNHCGPTAGTNLIYYWSHYGTPRQSQLWKGSVFQDLYKYMNTNVGITGTSTNYISDGLSTFAISRNDPIVDNYSSSGDWNFFVNYLEDNRPIITLVNGDPKYGNHYILSVGYQNTSTGQYLRIADGWSRTFSNFYKFQGKIADARYVSW